MISADSAPAPTAEPRVLVFSPRYVPDFYGPAAQVHQINVKLVELGVDVIVLTARHGPSDESIGGVRIESVKTGAPSAQPEGSVRLATETGRFAASLMTLRHQFDVIYLLGYTYQATALAVVARTLGKPVVIRRSIDVDLGRRSAAQRARDHIRERCTTALISVSLPTYEAARSSSSAITVYVPNGVDAAMFRPALHRDEVRRTRATLGLPVDAFIGLSVGAIHPRKGTLDVLRAWASAMGSDEDAVLALVGPTRDEAYAAAVHQAAGELGLSSRVVFCGHQHAVASYYRCADVFLFGSIREGLPNAVLEAMSSGVPVIARDIPGVHQLLGQGARGYPIASNDADSVVEGIAAAVLALRRNPADARARALSGRSYVCANHSLSSAAAGHLDLFRRVHRG